MDGSVFPQEAGPYTNCDYDEDCDHDDDCNYCTLRQRRVCDNTRATCDTWMSLHDTGCQNHDLYVCDESCDESCSQTARRGHDGRDDGITVNCVRRQPDLRHLPGHGRHETCGVSDNNSCPNGMDIWVPSSYAPPRPCTISTDWATRARGRLPPRSGCPFMRTSYAWLLRVP